MEFKYILFKSHKGIFKIGFNKGVRVEVLHRSDIGLVPGFKRVPMDGCWAESVIEESGPGKHGV